jgi:hypothetical protein
MELQVEGIINTSNKGRIGILFITRDKNLVELIFAERLLYEFFRNIEDIKLKSTQPFLPPTVNEEIDLHSLSKPVRYNVESIDSGSYSTGIHTVSLFLIIEGHGKMTLTFAHDTLQSLYHSLISDEEIFHRILGGLNINNAIKAIRNIHPEEAEVYIYLPDHVELIKQEEIVNACGAFMETLGFEIKTEDEPILNSFWKRLQFVFKKNITPEDADRLFNKGKQALELKLIDLHIADQTDKLANAAEKLLKSIENYENATIRLGTLLVIKREGQAFVHQLTSDEVFLLNKRPSIIKQDDPLESMQKILSNEIKPAMNHCPDTIKGIASTSPFAGDENVSDQVDEKDDKKLGSGNQK